MMRSLFSGVAGLRTHQTRMDVIGNNIANVNTVGFKSNNVTFQDLIYQTTANASGANADTGRGGVNAKQIGLGVSTAAINTNITTPGASQTTNNPFDLQISGDSFFIVNGGGENFFTRSGAFYVDGAGNLAMTSNGYNVMGWQADPKTQAIRKDTVSALRIMSPENTNADPEATKQAYFKGIIDKNSTQLRDKDNGLVTSISFYDNLGYSYVAKYSVKAVTDGSNNEIPGVFSIEIADIVDSSTNKSLVDTDGDGQISATEKANLKNYYSLDKADTDGKLYLYYEVGDSTGDGANGRFLGFNSTKPTDAAAAKTTRDGFSADDAKNK
nr:flagellar hook-basal body complex protein [Lachnospiraceae bacterium]